MSCDGKDFSGDDLPEVNLNRYEGESFENLSAYNLFIIEPDIRKDQERKKEVLKGSICKWYENN